MIWFFPIAQNVVIKKSMVVTRELTYQTFYIHFIILEYVGTMWYYVVLYTAQHILNTKKNYIDRAIVILNNII